jgi:rare lipoprotein A
MLPSPPWRTHGKAATVNLLTSFPGTFVHEASLGPAMDTSRLVTTAASLGLLCLLAACASGPAPVPVAPPPAPELTLAPPPPPVPQRQEAPPSDGDLVEQPGKASFYHDKFHGRTTANGERFDQEAMTAASTTLPLGSVVTVINLENGRSVDVRINDRGPFVSGRIIDLTEAAARKLEMTDDGVVKVKVEAKPEAQPTEQLKHKLRQKAAKKKIMTPPLKPAEVETAATPTPTVVAAD